MALALPEPQAAILITSSIVFYHVFYGASHVPQTPPFLWNDPLSGPLPNIPAGTYDVGDGYFDASANEVFAYDGNRLRKPTAEQAEWAKGNCRLGK